MNSSSVYNTSGGPNDFVRQTTLPSVIGIPIIIVNGITALFNIAIIVACLRSLKKKFHNLLVLTLCFVDLFLAVSLVCFCLSSMSEFLQTNVNLCRFQIFTLFLGFTSTYSIVFVICYERFLTVQSRNFGISQFLERFKYVFIGLTLGINFLVTFQTTFFIRHVDSLESCSPANLYKDDYIKFAEIWASSVTLICVFIFVTLIRTNILLWTIFFKRSTNVAPKQQKLSTEHNVENRRDTRSAGQLSWQLPGTSGVGEDNHSKSSDMRHKSMADAATEDQSITIEQQTDRVKIITLIDTLKENRHSIELKSAEISRVNKTHERKSKRVKLNEWEKRAFTTSLIIAFMTVSLTFPLICSVWYDIFSDSVMSKETRLSLVIPVMINVVTNPFMYAWRITEIRMEFGKLLHINN